MLNLIYLLVNALPMPFWIMAIARPRHRLSKRLARTDVLLLLAGAIYALLLAYALVMIVTGGTTGVPTGTIDFTTPDGLAALFGTPFGALTGWAHMLALDLATGMWIFRNAERYFAGVWVVRVCLFFTLMSGPFGLLLYLFWRRRAGLSEFKVG